MGMTAVDFEEIKQLHARYCHAVDFGDTNGIGACFTPDGIFEMAFDPGHPANRRGEEIRRSPTGSTTTGHGRHTTLSSIIDGDGVTARSLSSLIMSRDFGPPLGKGRVTFSRIGASGLYLDELVKIDGRWVYAKRTFAGDTTPGVVEDRRRRPIEINPVNAGETRDTLSPLDYEAIRQLLARYGFTLDFEDDEGFADCFTADGSYEERRLVDIGSDAKAQGREELRELAAALRKVFGGRARHSALAEVIEGDGARAHVSSYAFITVDAGVSAQPNYLPDAAVRTTGIYRDEVVKVDGRWLFSKRTYRSDTLQDVQALAGRPLELKLFGPSR